jgi:acetyl esterase/lipase
MRKLNRLARKEIKTHITPFCYSSLLLITIMTGEPIEVVFKTVDKLSISLDIYLPKDATADTPAPVLIWWHGGGLLQGTRKGCAPHLLRAPDLHNICVVSADYRLAPQSRLPAILSDVRDAVAYVQSEKFTADTKSKADSKRLVLSGSSAGGWLALLAGSQLGFKECGIPLLKEKIAATVPIYPITDITAPFWNTKQHPVSYMKGKIIDGPKQLGPYLDETAPEVAASALDSPRSSMYHYMIQEAILPSLLLKDTGLSPEVFSVAAALNEGRISMPPTLLLHGDIDDKVPISQAEDVYNALQKKGIEVDFVVEKNKDHLYDREEKEEMKEMYSFIKRITH